MSVAVRTGVIGQGTAHQRRGTTGGMRRRRQSPQSDGVTHDVGPLALPDHTDTDPGCGPEVVGSVVDRTETNRWIPTTRCSQGPGVLRSRTFSRVPYFKGNLVWDPGDRENP